LVSAASQGCEPLDEFEDGTAVTIDLRPLVGVVRAAIELIHRTLQPLLQTLPASRRSPQGHGTCHPRPRRTRRVGCQPRRSASPPAGTVAWYHMQCRRRARYALGG